MKNTMLRSLSLLGASLVMTLSVAAQDIPKVKTDEKETKYKSEDVKAKQKKDETKIKLDDLKVKEKKDETKYKSDDLKVKNKKDQTKYKGDDLKVKEDDEEKKIKAKVEPLEKTSTESTEIKIGETDVKVKEQVVPIPTEPPVAERIMTERAVVPPPPAPVVKKAPAKKYAAKKSTPRKRTVSNKPKTIVRTKVVRDTVYVPSPPEKEIYTQKEYVHIRDTVTITRVDTVVKTQIENTYDGYNVPQGDFTKVKLKKDKDDGEVWMKRKEKDGKIKTEKLEKK